MVAIAYFAPQLAPAVANLLGTTVAVATAVVTAGLTIAASVAMKVIGLTPRPSVPSARQGTPTVFRQSITDSFLVYGRRRVGGLMVFFHAKKVGKAYFRYFVIAVAGHRCQGNPTWMLNDEVVAVDGTGLVTSGPYAGHAWLWFQRGLAAETANVTFIAECDGKWTANHKGNGTAAIYAKFEMTDDVVQAGMPNITAVVTGRDEIADPRSGTVGYSNNAALVFYDWMAISREEGGFGAYPDELPDPTWISAQANVCDETVGGEARYALDGLIVTGAAPSEIRDALVTNCAGSFTYSGGKFLMRPGYYVPVTETLEEDDLAGPITVNAFMSGDQSANEVQGTFVDPAGGYQGAAFATQSAATTDVRQMDLDLAYITSKARAERIASIMLRRALAEKTVQWPMNIRGLAVAALDTVRLDTDRYGLSNYAFQVTNWGLSADYGVVLSLREENAEIYDPPATAAAGSVATISKATPIMPSTQLSQLILNSYVTGRTITGSASAIVISNHSRVYSDRTVAVTGATLTATRVAGTWLVYYDDADRSGGAETYVATQTAASAYNSSTHPDRHFVGTVVIPATGSSSGGGATPPGSGGGYGGGAEIP